MNNCCMRSADGIACIGNGMVMREHAHHGSRLKGQGPIHRATFEGLDVEDPRSGIGLRSTTEGGSGRRATPGSTGLDATCRRDHPRPWLGLVPRVSRRTEVRRGRRKRRTLRRAETLATVFLCPNGPRPGRCPRADSELPLLPAPRCPGPTWSGGAGLAGEAVGAPSPEARRR